ncbi:MAG TPA: thioredoxin domain-containing protein [Kofleriaceae bacterium]|jgi:protein-disulfide isomerase|nr:thioredoxin domain-containing protein [Kofleriaceae bacterium]
MNKLIVVAVVVVAACQADNKNLERKIEDLNKKLDTLSAQLARGGAGAGAQQRQARAEPDRAKTYAVPIDGDPVEGPADAKVTLVKAYDYACPFCEKVRDAMDELRKKYPNDLRIVYKQLVVHPQQAHAAALAACAADKQGKFREFDTLLWDEGYKKRQFENACWDAPAGCPIMVGFAQQLGLNADKFKADMKGDCQQLVQKDMKELAALGVGSTPTFFINGRYMVGAAPTESFVALVDEELKKANERIAAGTPAASYYQQVVLDKGVKQLERPQQ